MKKAVLVIDMPESINGETPCKHCSLQVAEYDGYYHHYVCQDITTVDGDEWEIYKKCPLKPTDNFKKYIPIEWIKRYAKKGGRIANILFPFEIEMMLEDWEEENE